MIITPHAAYYSEEAIHTVHGFAASEVVRVLTGQPPLSPVNADQIANARRTAGPRLTLGFPGTQLRQAGMNSRSREGQ